MKFVAFDPGGKTGWVQMEREKPLQGGEVKYDDFLDFLEESPPIAEAQVFVIEDYIIRHPKDNKGYAHQWNKGEALQVIGALKLKAFQLDIPVVLQQPQAKYTIHRKLNGTDYKKSTATHMMDAALHGAYYWNKENPLESYEFKGSNENSVEERVSRPARVVTLRGYKGLRGKRN